MDGAAGQRERKRVADLLVLLALAGVVGIYLFDALRASKALLHLILVLPVGLAILTLCLAELVRSFAPGTAAGAEAPAERERPSDVALVAGLFGAYVATLPWLGFDVGTVAFVAIFLRLHGERRWRWLAAYSLAFGFGLALAFSALLPYAMPMLLLSAGAG